MKKKLLVGLAISLFVLSIAGMANAYIVSPEEGGSASPVPEPSTILLFGAGMAALAAAGRKRK